jgi:hypothetical protein
VAQGKESEWNNFYSDWGKYNSEDYFLHYAFYHQTATINKAERAFLWLSYIAVLFLAILKLLYPDAHPILQRLPDARLLLLLATLMLVSWAIAWARRVAREKADVTEANVVWTNRVVQVVPSTGSIRFGFGDRGLCVMGVSCQCLFEWAAIESICDKPESLKNAPESIIIKFKKESGVNISQYVVIPCHFFESDRNSSGWDTFRRELKKFDPSKNLSDFRAICDSLLG